MHEYNMDNTEPPSPNCMPVLLSVSLLNIHALIIIDVTHFILQIQYIQVATVVMGHWLIPKLETMLI